MSDQTWKYLEYFFIITIIGGAILLTYFMDGRPLSTINGNPFIKWGVGGFILVGVFVIILSEVRKRTDGLTLRAFGITAAVFLIGFLFFFAIR